MNDARPWLANYPQGVPATIDPDSYASINDVLQGAIDKHRDRVAFLRICSGRFAAGMKIVEDYVEGRIELDEMIKLMTDPNV